MGEEYVHASRTPTTRSNRWRSTVSSATDSVDARRAHVELGELCVLSPRPDRRSAPDGRHLYRMAKSPYLVKGQDADDPLRNEALKPVRQLRHRRQRDERPRHGVWRPVDRQRRCPPRARTTSSGSSRSTAARSTSTTAPAPRCIDRDVGPQDDRRAEARDHQSERNRSAVPARRRPTGGRQDRHTGQQHQRLVRRVHPAAHHRRVGGQSQRVRRDGRHPRVQPVRRRRRGAGWPHPGDVVEGVHGPGARRSPDGGLGATAAAPPTRKPVRLFLPGMECAKRIVGYDHVVLGFANPTGRRAGDGDGLAGTRPARRHGTAPTPLRPASRRTTRSRSAPRRPGKPGKPGSTTDARRPTAPPPPQTAYVPIYENVDGDDDPTRRRRPQRAVAEPPDHRDRVDVLTARRRSGRLSGP